MRKFVLALALPAILVACGQRNGEQLSPTQGVSSDDPVTANMRHEFAAAHPPKASELVLSHDYTCISHDARPGSYIEESGYAELTKIGTLIQVGSLLLSQSISYDLHDGAEAVAKIDQDKAIVWRVTTAGALIFEQAETGTFPVDPEHAISQPAAYSTNYMLCQLPG